MISVYKEPIRRLEEYLDRCGQLGFTPSVVDVTDVEFAGGIPVEIALNPNARRISVSFGLAQRMVADYMGDNK